MKLLDYQQAFGATERTSEQMREAIDNWFSLYYRAEVTEQADPCQRIAYTVVNKVVKAVFGEYSVRVDDPFYTALLEKLVPIICIIVLLIGEILQTNQPFWAIFLLVPAGMLVLMVADATTVLKLDGSTFTIRRWGREKTYRIEDVRGVLWRKHRGLLRHSMVLVLHDGKSYWFDMDVFCGVQSVYDYISQRI